MSTFISAFLQLINFTYVMAQTLGAFRLSNNHTTPGPSSPTLLDGSFTVFALLKNSSSPSSLFPNFRRCPDLPFAGLISTLKKCSTESHYHTYPLSGSAPYVLSFQLLLESIVKVLY